jgi:alpha-1,3-glucan synthase
VSFAPSSPRRKDKDKLTGWNNRPEKRKLMRAWSAKQRFPVAQWVKQLDELHSESIRIHKKEARKKKLDVVSKDLTRPSSRLGEMTRPSSRASTVTVEKEGGWNRSTVSVLSPSPDFGPLNSARLASPLIGRIGSPGIQSDSLPTPNAPWAGGRSNSPRDSIASSIGDHWGPSQRDSTISVDSFAMRQQNGGYNSPVGLSAGGFGGGAGLGLPQPAYSLGQHRNSSLLSLPDVVGDRHDLKLQKVDQTFQDSNGEFYAEFDEMLEGLTAKNSAGDMCIESFLKKSEKEWFARYRDAKLGRLRDSSTNRSPGSSRPQSRNGNGGDSRSVSRGRQRYRSATPSGLGRPVFDSSVFDHEPESPPHVNMVSAVDDEFLLGEGYQAPKGLRK